MENKINIAELLKDCPKGMELDCVMFNNVTLEGVYADEYYPIQIKIGKKQYQHLTAYGEWYKSIDNSKCVIFPKGKTTWDGFVPPRKFMDGDIVSAIISSVGGTWIGIFKQYENGGTFETYCSLSTSGEFINTNSKRHLVIGAHLATEEEKAKLFKSIKEKYYRWDPETKTLEKLIEPKFKVGDIIKKVNGDKKGIITDIVTDIVNDGYYKLEIKEEDYYYVSITNQNNWELSIDKFNINTLKPFAQVLVRDDIGEKWHIQLFEKYNKNLQYPFKCVYSAYKQCIPYKGNELLLDTKDDCDNFYKTWEE
jgi:hypothetical protein